MDEKIIEILFKNEEKFNDEMPLFVPRWRYKTIADEILKAINYAPCCEELSDKKIITFEEWMEVHEIIPHKTTCDVGGRVACKGIVEDWYKQYVERQKA